jgi:CRP-like cAMP-binding protein
MSHADQAELIRALAQVALFADLPDPAMARLAGAVDQLRPADGTQLFAAGGEADSLFAVLPCDGAVRVGAGDIRGKRLLVERFTAGDVFGELGALDGTPRSADAVVEGRVRLAKLGSVAFRRMLAVEPLLGVALSRLLAGRLRRTFTLLQDAAFESLESRLARQLLYLVRDLPPGPGGLRIPGRFRQGDLADLLGTTTRSIITILNAWRAAGVVAYDTDRAILTILDRPRIEALLSQG